VGARSSACPGSSCISRRRAPGALETAKTRRIKNESQHAEPQPADESAGAPRRVLPAAGADRLGGCNDRLELGGRDGPDPRLAERVRGRRDAELIRFARVWLYQERVDQAPPGRKTQRPLGVGERRTRGDARLVMRRLERDYRAIVQFARAGDVRLIFITYPFPKAGYLLANSAILATSRLGSAPEQAGLPRGRPISFLSWSRGNVTVQTGVATSSRPGDAPSVSKSLQLLC